DPEAVAALAAVDEARQGDLALAHSEMASAQALKDQFADSPHFLRQLAALEAFNAPVLENNAAIYSALARTTGQGFGEDRDAWKQWHIGALGYAIKPEAQQITSQSKPTITKRVLFQSTYSCFAAGTPVRTFTGPRPIESIQVGDRVLAQDTATGALSFEPVL